ncbi:Hypothetical protein PAS_chr3_0871 [Komagataella phaffii GS115]|uniref:Zn(2)-C6 fungal-type domain-containing protein n=2 Tax=Komagataella phaffii TaxID=460519 RepID=C4R5U2_KOMPG|nr:Hypothetical protein PAS_chr3_0871 [Komagataella phaffii GS115]AOA63971.1 GQ67_03990T0 [Komagataella phaffii]AOA69135.1 GQ68_03963T0 [Komagataella phaffii GS115]CAY70928.1 Hypothetical protein PAS_chr3_0871 [Komagataella phaffii GS115]
MNKGPGSKGTRSRFGCRNCKRRKIKCDEQKPRCGKCVSGNLPECDYSIQLQWGRGRPYKTQKVLKMDPIPDLFNSREAIYSTSMNSEGSSSTVNTIPDTPTVTIKTEPFQLQIDDAIQKASDQLVKKHDLPIDLNHLGIVSELIQEDSDHLSMSTSDSVNIPSNQSELPFNPNSEESVVEFMEDFDSYAQDLTSSNKLNKSHNYFHEIPLLHNNHNSLHLPSDEHSDAINSFVEDDDEFWNFLSNTFIQNSAYNDNSNSQSNLLQPLDAKPPESAIKLYKKSLQNEFSRLTSMYNVYHKQIPNGILPLPDMLLSVPYYYESFIFFKEVTSSVLVPMPHHLYRENPVEILLPRLAMGNSTVMAILISFAITHKCYMTNTEEPREVVDQLMARILNDLLTFLQHPETATSDLTLAVILLLSSYDIFSSKQQKWRLHMKGAKQILLSRGVIKTLPNTESSDQQPSVNGVLASSSKMIKESNILAFIIRWFAYIDTLGSLCSPLKPSPEEMNSHLQSIGNTNTELGNHINYDDPRLHSYIDAPEGSNINSIDLFLGFDVKLLAISTELCVLIKRVNCILHSNQGKEVSLPISLITKAMDVEYRLWENYETSLDKVDRNAGADSSHLALATNKLFYYAGLINLYRRVLLLPRQSSMVQKCCRMIRETLEKHVEPGSSAEICSIFCVFICGCEVIDEADQKFFDAKMINLDKKGVPCAPKALQIMRMAWKTSKTHRWGRNWDDIMEETGMDLVFL